MTIQNFHNLNRRRLLLGALLAIALSLVAFLALTTVYSSDDYWYSTFMNDGVRAYFQRMKDHYLTFNGRMLVHFLAHTFLHVGNWLFAVFLVGSCILIPTAICLLGGVPKTDVDRILLCDLLFTAGFLALPRSVMVQGVLWISASCNYLFPTDLVVLETLFLQRVLRREGRCPRWIWLFVFCFLCGATTEQMGAAAVLIPLGFVLKAILQKNKRGWGILVLAASAACGLMTIFLSPATQGRVNGEALTTTSTTFSQRVTDSLALQTASFTESVAIPLVVAALFVCTGYMLFRQKNVPKWCGVLWLVVSLGSLPLLWLTEQIGMILLYFVLFVQALVWFLAGHEAFSLLFLSVVVSMGVMLPTFSWGGRTFLPFCLCMLGVLALILTELLSKLRQAHCVMVFSALSLMAFVMISLEIPHYWYNYQVDQMNKDYIAQADANGCIYYFMDYDKDYTHTKAHFDGYFYKKWLECNGIDDTVYDIYFYSEDQPSVYVNEVMSTVPAACHDDGIWYLPLRSVMSGLGGEIVMDVDETGGRFTIVFDGITYGYVANKDDVTITWQDPDGTAHIYQGQRDTGAYTVRLSEDFFTDVLGLDVVHEDGGIYIDRP